MKHFVLIFTDLDGSLLDHHDYSWSAAAADIDIIKKRGIPLIYNTSKTYPECTKLQQSMGICDPFIIENGSAIVFPKHSTLLEIIDPQLLQENEEVGHILHLGSEYNHLCTLLDEWITHYKLPIIGFNHMSTEKIAEETGLSLADAKLAAGRSSSLPFTFGGSPQQLSMLENLAQTHQLKILKGGRFYHLIGQSDKGTALEYLTTLYNQRLNATGITLAFGDSQNDIAMLESSHYPTAIPSASGQQNSLSSENLSNSNTFFATKPGPAGWSQGFMHQMRAINFS